MKLNRVGVPLSRDERNQINENWETIEKNISDVKQTNQAALDYVADQAYAQVLDRSKLDWKEPVSTFANLPTNAGQGETRMARDTGKVYRFEDNKWTEIQEINAGPVNELDDRLTRQLADISNLELAAGIAETNYNAGRKVDVSFIRTRQAVLYGEFMQKLRNLKPAKITCIGDSLTFGYDLVSSDVRPDPKGGNVTIASKTYPEMLQESLNKVYNNNVTVTTRGYSGDWVEKGYNRWKAKHHSDLSIIMYGTNDATSQYMPEGEAGNIDNYIYWYEQFIIREILWGKAVIILTPPKLKSATNIELDAFRNSLYMLGEKYDIPVVDSERFLKNYTPDIYSDGTHLNGTGYSIFGAKVASLFIGESVKKFNSVGGGTKLLTRPTIDNIVYFGGATMSTNIPTETPNETDASRGIVANIPSGGGVIYSFYAEKDDLITFPYAYLNSGATMTLELDFGVIQPQNSIDGALFEPMGRENEPSSVKYPNEGLIYSKDNIIKNNKQVLRIVSDGWHTLKITATGGTVILNGIEFSSFDTPKVQRHLNGLVTDPNGIHGLKIESGNWTPKWGSANDGSHAYSIQEGTYYKIGKLVFARGILTMTSKDSAMSGTYLSIKGLPFVPAKVTPVTIASAQNITLPSDKTRIFASASTSGNIALKAGDINGSDVALTSAAITNTSSIEFSIIYLGL